MGVVELRGSVNGGGGRCESTSGVMSGVHVYVFQGFFKKGDECMLEGQRAESITGKRAR